MYVLVAKKTYKNDSRMLCAVLKKKPVKTTAVWSLASHLRNHSSKTNKTSRARLKKQGETHK